MKKKKELLPLNPQEPSAIYLHHHAGDSNSQLHLAVSRKQNVVSESRADSPNSATITEQIFFWMMRAVKLPRAACFPPDVST